MITFKKIEADKKQYMDLDVYKRQESYWGDETTGARRRYYRITRLGRAMYEQNKEEWERTKQLIDHLI